MNKNYIEPTGQDQFALHMDKEMLSFIFDAANGCDHPTAIKLRRILFKSIDIRDVFPFTVDRKIEICHKCGGSGLVRNYLTGNWEYDHSPCPVCNGKTGIVKIVTTRFEDLTDFWRSQFTK